MSPYRLNPKAVISYIRKVISITVLVAFMMTSLRNPAYAQVIADPMPRLPMPGVMVHLSPEFTPSHLLGITIHPDNSLQFDFLIHKGDKVLDDDQKKDEYKKLVKYFLASLTIPDEDQWVNLSPYERNRIIQDNFGKTEMGRDLLAEDYLLKQITSSLIYPEDGLGKKFWDRIYERAWKEYHTTDVPVNTFNKVWIVPDQAIVYESGNTAYILQSHLKVMLEEDYLSLEKHTAIDSGSSATITKINDTHAIGSQVVREIVLPELEKEVNEGKNFANLRQMFGGMILATWYKNALKESLLGKIYADKAKVVGVNQDPKTNELIYKRYIKAFKKGVFNYIKEDVDKYSNEAIPRKYFSGGFTRGTRGISKAVKLSVNFTAERIRQLLKVQGVVLIVIPATIGALLTASPASAAEVVKGFNDVSVVDRATVDFNQSKPPIFQPSSAVVKNVEEKAGDTAMTARKKFINFLKNNLLNFNKNDLLAFDKNNQILLASAATLFSAKTTDDLNIKLAETNINNFIHGSFEGETAYSKYTPVQRKMLVFNWIVLMCGQEKAKEWVEPLLKPALDARRIDPFLYKYALNVLNDGFQFVSSTVKTITLGPLIDQARKYNLMSKGMVQQIIPLLFSFGSVEEMYNSARSGWIKKGDQFIVVRNHGVAVPIVLKEIYYHPMSGPNTYLRGETKDGQTITIYQYEIESVRYADVAMNAKRKIVVFEDNPALKDSLVLDWRMKADEMFGEGNVDVIGAGTIEEAEAILKEGNIVLGVFNTENQEGRKNPATPNAPHWFDLVLDNIQTDSNPNGLITFPFFGSSGNTEYDMSKIWQENIGSRYKGYQGFIQKSYGHAEIENALGQVKEAVQDKIFEYYAQEIVLADRTLLQPPESYTQDEMEGYLDKQILEAVKGVYPGSDLHVNLASVNRIKGLLAWKLTDGQYKIVAKADEAMTATQKKLLKHYTDIADAIRHQDRETIKKAVDALKSTLEDPLYKEFDVKKTVFFELNKIDSIISADDKQSYVDKLGDFIFSLMSAGTPTKKQLNSDAVNNIIDQVKDLKQYLADNKAFTARMIDKNVFQRESSAEGRRTALERFISQLILQRGIPKVAWANFKFEGENSTAVVEAMEAYAQTVLDRYKTEENKAELVENARIAIASLKNEKESANLQNFLKKQTYGTAEDILLGLKNYLLNLGIPFNFSNGVLESTMLKDTSEGGKELDSEKAPELANKIADEISSQYGDLAMKTNPSPKVDKASVTPGGIDLNGANLNLQIKRDGRGVPLPLNQQDMAQLNNIEGFVPEIIEIKPAINVPIINELQQKLQSSLPAMANPA